MGGEGIVLIILCALVALLAGVVVGPLMMILGVVALIVAAVGALAVESIQFSFSSSLHLVVAGAVLLFISSLFWAVSVWALEWLAMIPEGKIRAVTKWVRYLFVRIAVGAAVVCAGHFLYVGFYLGVGAVLLISPFLWKDVRKKACEVMGWNAWLFIGIIFAFVIFLLYLKFSIAVRWESLLETTK